MVPRSGRPRNPSPAASPMCRPEIARRWAVPVRRRVSRWSAVIRSRTPTTRASTRAPAGPISGSSRSRRESAWRNPSRVERAGGGQPADPGVAGAHVSLARVAVPKQPGLVVEPARVAKPPRGAETDHEPPGLAGDEVRRASTGVFVPRETKASLLPAGARSRRRSRTGCGAGRRRERRRSAPVRTRSSPSSAAGGDAKRWSRGR